MLMYHYSESRSTCMLPAQLPGHYQLNFPVSRSADSSMRNRLKAYLARKCSASRVAKNEPDSASTPPIKVGAKDDSTDRALNEAPHRK